MKKEKVIEGMSIVKKIEELQKSNVSEICNNVLVHNAPFRFGHNYMENKGDHLSQTEYSRGHTCLTFTVEEKEEVQDEYIRFIERVKKMLDRKIKRLEKELADLKAE